MLSLSCPESLLFRASHLPSQSQSKRRLSVLSVTGRSVPSLPRCRPQQGSTSGPAGRQRGPVSRPSGTSWWWLPKTLWQIWRRDSIKELMDCRFGIALILQEGRSYRGIMSLVVINRLLPDNALGSESNFTFREVAKNMCGSGTTVSPASDVSTLTFITNLSWHCHESRSNLHVKLHESSNHCPNTSEQEQQ